MTELPNGWATATLGEVADVVAGQSPAGVDVNESGEGVPFFQGKAEFGDLYPEIRKWTTNAARTAASGDVLLSVRAPVGPTNVAPVDCAIGRGLMAIRRHPSFADRYLLWVLRSSAEQLRSFATGSTFEAVTGPVVRQHVVAVAPSAEQERIVAAIEEAFSKLDAGEAGLRTVRQLLKRMRAAVLAAAVTGRLASQDPADTPAASLFADLRVAQVSGRHETPSTWAWAALGSLLREPLRNGMSAVKADATKGLPTFSITSVTTGDFSSANIKYTAGDWNRAEDLWAEAGDVFVQRSNTPELVGTARLYRGAPRAAIFPDLLIRVRPIPEVRPAWLELVMSSPRCRAYIRSQAKGLAGSMPKISQPVLEKLAVPVPPEDEQDRIVAEVERHFSFIEACERAVDTGLARAAALRRSVLKAAFEGRLVPQDPSDEPASVLLERIRAERAVGDGSGGGRRRKKVEAS